MQQKHYKYLSIFFLAALIIMTAAVIEQHQSIVYAGTLSNL